MLMRINKSICATLLQTSLSIEKIEHKYFGKLRLIMVFLLMYSGRKGYSMKRIDGYFHS